MALMHVAFPEGAPIDLEQGAANLAPQIGRIAADKSILRTETLLTQGITRVTPGHWKKHTHEYFAEALPNGDGVLHMLPRDKGVAFMTSENPDELLRGGRHTLLPQESMYLPILGPRIVGEVAQLVMYSLVVHMPEESLR